MPTAAKIASSRVGGSRRTRRVPYLVFQSSLMGASRLVPGYLVGVLLHCNMNLMWHVSYALPIFTGLPACSRRKSAMSGRRPRADAGRGRSSREAGTAKCAASAARSAHCSTKTSRSGFSQSTCTACEMHPGSVRERCTCSRLSSRTSPNVSGRAVTLPVTRIIARSPTFSRRRLFRRLLRPALQRGAARIRQLIDTAFGAVEPAIDIVQQDLAGIGTVLAQIPHLLRSGRQCAAQASAC